MISREWNALPMWTAPLEAMSPEAIELMCDADKRPQGALDTLIVRLHPLPLTGGKS